MKYFAIDMLPLCLFAAALFGMKPVKTGEINEDYLSYKTMKNLKGFFCMVIVFHHVSQSTTLGFLLPRFSYVGYLAVCVFFFCSGFGLQKSYMTGRESYANRFFARRLPAILLPYTVVTVMYWLFYNGLGDHFTAFDIIGEILRGYPIASYSWYVITILLFYPAFWLMMVFCKNRDRTMVAAGGVWYVFYALCLRKAGLPAWWYNTAYVLILGMAWAVWEKELTSFLKKHPWIVGAAWIAFGIVWFLPDALRAMLPGGARVLAASILFTAAVVLLGAKVKLGNRVTEFLGRISFEIYLTQGFFITLYRSDVMFVKHSFVFALLVTGSTLLSAYVLHTVFAGIFAAYQKYIG